MNEFQQNFIHILKAAFPQGCPRADLDIDLEMATAVAKRHNIAPIFYYGALNCGISKTLAPMQELHQLTLKNVMVSVRQTCETENIFRAFEEAGIAYMPLKGTVLKAVYPKPEMRTMGDADILIKTEQYPQIQAIMEQLRFTFQEETDHEMIWVKPTLYLELHKRIMTRYNQDFYNYFGSGWKLAQSVPGSCAYQLSLEDFYIFMFVHFTKHYRISGIGIKHLLDLWVYTQAHPDIRWDYVEQELAKMHLSEFHDNIRQTLKVWFDDAPCTDVTELITNVIFHSGQYGSTEMAIINRSLQTDGDSVAKIKTHRLWNGLFPGYKQMARKYPILEKAPILLPFFWIGRIFSAVIFRRNNIQKVWSNMEKIEKNKLEENALALRMVGLDFHFTE